MKTHDEIVDLYEKAALDGGTIENPNSYYWYGWLAFMENRSLTNHTHVDEWQKAYKMGYEDAKGSKELEESAS